MLVPTCEVPSAARWTLREISCVAEPCCPTEVEIAAEISEIRPIVVPISLIAATESRVADWMSEICWLISSVAFAVCSASDFTSDATTAKPRPASPARAASMVAFSASRLVWPAMVWMRSTTSPIRLAACDSSLMRESVFCAWLTASPAIRAEVSTWRLISPIEDASSSLAAATECTFADASFDAVEARPETCATVSAVFDRVVKLAGAERGHAFLQPRERFDHAAADGPGDRNRNQHQHGDDDGGGLHHRPERIVDLGHVFGRADHLVAPRTTAREGNLVERGGISAAATERVAQRALALLRHVHQRDREQHAVGVLVRAHVLADELRNAGVGDAQPGLVVVDIGVVAVVFVPDVIIGLEEALLGFFLRHLAGLEGLVVTVSQIPDDINGGMRLLDPLGDELIARDPQHRGSDQRHADRTDHGHDREFGADRAKGNQVLESRHSASSMLLGAVPTESGSRPSRGGNGQIRGNSLRTQLRHECAVKRLRCYREVNAVARGAAGYISREHQPSS